MVNNGYQHNPEAEANRILQTIWKDKGFPVDPIAIAKAMGIQVQRASFKDPKVDGAVVHYHGETTIYANPKQSKTRMRFTVAHELGHVIDKQLSNGEEYGYIDFRKNLPSMEIKSPAEIFANQFAAALLMPEKAVRANASFLDKISEMAEYFGVSRKAMEYRLLNLQVVTIPTT